MKSTYIDSMAHYLSLRRLGLSNHTISYSSSDTPVTPLCLCGYSHHAACTFSGKTSRFLYDDNWYEFLQKSRKKK